MIQTLCQHKVQDTAQHTLGAHHWFLFKKISMLTYSGVSLVRILLTVRPAAENTRSDGTDVPGMHKHLGNLVAFALRF